VLFGVLLAFELNCERRRAASEKNFDHLHKHTTKKSVIVRVYVKLCGCVGTVVRGDANRRPAARRPRSPLLV
jgi:hypothetical protein